MSAATNEQTETKVVKKILHVLMGLGDSEGLLVVHSVNRFVMDMCLMDIGNV